MALLTLASCSLYICIIFRQLMRMDMQSLITTFPYKNKRKE
ncbi:Uncharacterised protein [Klebsiella pneumoniae]|nr:Uncharacterised protein [Klebsiella pneumoniae]